MLTSAKPISDLRCSCAGLQVVESRSCLPNGTECTCTPFLSACFHLVIRLLFKDRAEATAQQQRARAAAFCGLLASIVQRRPRPHDPEVHRATTPSTTLPYQCLTHPTLATNCLVFRSQFLSAPVPLTCDPVRLIDEFPRLLEKTSSRIPGGVVIVLDSADQFRVHQILLLR